MENHHIMTGARIQHHTVPGTRPADARGEDGCTTFEVRSKHMFCTSHSDTVAMVPVTFARVKQIVKVFPSNEERSFDHATFPLQLAMDQHHGFALLCEASTSSVQLSHFDAGWHLMSVAIHLPQDILLPGGRVVEVARINGPVWIADQPLPRVTVWALRTLCSCHTNMQSSANFLGFSGAEEYCHATGELMNFWCPVVT